MKEINIISVDKESWNEVLKIFEIDLKKRRCYFCSEQLTIDNLGGIMPSKTDKTPILMCDKTFCIAQYIAYREKK